MEVEPAATLRRRSRVITLVREFYKMIASDRKHDLTVTPYAVVNFLVTVHALKEGLACLRSPESPTVGAPTRQGS